MNIALDSYKHFKNTQYLFVFFLFLLETDYFTLRSQLFQTHYLVPLQTQVLTTSYYHL